MADAVPLGCRDGSAKEVRLVMKEPLPRIVPDDEAAYWKEELSVVLSLKVSPQFVRTESKRRVMHPLADRKSSNSSFSMRRSMWVRWRELVDAEHAHPGFGQVIESRGPHRAKANNESVIRGFFGHTVCVSHRTHGGTVKF